MFSRRNSSGFCCLAMKRPLQKLKGDVLCVFEKKKKKKHSVDVRAGGSAPLCADIDSVRFTAAQWGGPDTRIGWVCWCSQIAYCWEVGNVGAIPVSTAVLRAQQWCSLTRYTQTRPPRKFNRRVTTIVRIKMEAVSVKFMKAGVPDSESDTWGGGKLLEMCR